MPDLQDIVIASAVRTPIGSLSGRLGDLTAPALGAIAIREALLRANVPTELVDEVIMGNVLQAGVGMNPARQAALAAGLPDSVPAMTINKVCGSGLKSVALGAQAILTGDAEIVVAGGQESMTKAPYIMPSARQGARMGHTQMLDSMILDGLWCAMADCHMGITAENVAAEYEISRLEQDEFAARSQALAARAIENGVFAEEMTPVAVPQRKGDPVIVDADEYPRPGTTAERLGGLPAAFKKDGMVTAGNASGINDGAAAVVLMTAKKAQELGVRPLAKIRSYASAGVRPEVMGVGPVPAARKALDRAQVSVGQLDLIEANEAFAAQSIAVQRELGLDPERLNVNGGAIALGHPIGASGTRVLTTLLYEMRRRGSHLGLATLCIGGGMGIAMVVENGS